MHLHPISQSCEKKKPCRKTDHSSHPLSGGRNRFSGGRGSQERGEWGWDSGPRSPDAHRPGWGAVQRLFGPVLGLPILWPRHEDGLVLTNVTTLLWRYGLRTPLSPSRVPRLRIRLRAQPQCDNRGQPLGQGSAESRLRSGGPGIRIPGLLLQEARVIGGRALGFPLEVKGAGAEPCGCHLQLPLPRAHSVPSPGWQR